MDRDIKAILLDVGNTLRIVVPDEPFQALAKQQLATLIGAPEPVETLFERLTARWKEYRQWSTGNLTEVREQELWTRFLLPDYPTEQIGPLAGKLTRLWREREGHRVPRGDAKETLVELYNRGYRLGIVANTITENEIPDWIEADGLAPYLTTVILSSKVRYRKPGPEIFWEATRCTGIPPERSAYVGDDPLRDVVGARKAGFGLIILLRGPEEWATEGAAGENTPDIVAHELRALLDIFPPRRAPWAN